MRTDDGGQTWQFILNGIGEVVTYQCCFHPTDSNRLYIPALMSAAPIVTDGGFSGNTVSMLKPFFRNDGLGVFASRLVSSNNGVNRYIFSAGRHSTTGRALYTTTNDGTSWYYPGDGWFADQQPRAMHRIDAVDSLDNPDDFLVVCGGNGGRTWAACIGRPTAGIRSPNATGILSPA